jgi:hypothetical protein
MAEFRSASELTLTILTGEPMLSRVLDELKSMPKSTADRIKYVSGFFLSANHITEGLTSVMDIGALTTPFEPQLGFIPLFQNLWAGKAVAKVSASEAVVLPRPSVVVLDVRDSSDISFAMMQN